LAWANAIIGKNTDLFKTVGANLQTKKCGGVSAESGIPTFRGAGQQTVHTYNAISTATVQVLLESRVMSDQQIFGDREGLFLMSNVLQISPQLWQLKMGMVNAYLLETSDGVLLVDAGWPNKTEAIFKAVRESGHNPEDIRHLVLTHGHIDHAGSAAEVRRRTGARTYAHAR
jgi:beta-lactamase superfamily II metal-dependent hydrolase